MIICKTAVTRKGQVVSERLPSESFPTQHDPARTTAVLCLFKHLGNVTVVSHLATFVLGYTGLHPIGALFPASLVIPLKVWRNSMRLTRDDPQIPMQKLKGRLIVLQCLTIIEIHREAPSA